MKVRPYKSNGFILTGETEFERNGLDLIDGQVFEAKKGVGGDMLFCIQQKEIIDLSHTIKFNDGMDEL